MPAVLAPGDAVESATVRPVAEPIRVRAKFFFEGDEKWFLKGVTYGPFKPNADGDLISTPEQARIDFGLMRALGINLLRVYHVPPRWLLDLAAEFGLRVLISIPWTEHVEFLNSRKLRRQIVQTIRVGASKHAGHPAVFGYLIGNEVPTTIVRWLGATRVIAFLERLIDVARTADPRALISYASYPPTEYLLPANVDFLTFNVYLERRNDFERYLARLQNLAEEKPLILGEFGLDTRRKGEAMQAEVLDWHLDGVVKGGAAGTIFFSWTDEWFTGGQEILDWEFGLVTRDRRPKKAYRVLEKKLRGDDSITSHVRLRSYPFVSVIVCSYNGAKTVGDCLRALDQIDYPHYEIVFVDDGSTDRTQDVIAEWVREREEHPAREALPDFQNVQQTNLGLSAARNRGASAARGEIVAYTDSDCMPDRDWLYFIVGMLLSGDYAGVGGPNISPPAVNWIQAAVAAAPGGPSHVLLTDVIAEHIPGCNMAFFRWAFERVGGFDPEYRKAGDDVDFCWRLQNSGAVIAFSPTAIVWHYRRFTLKAFRAQQRGYGEAEAMLRFKHLIFFGPTGQAKWKGQIYGGPRFSWLLNRPLIYHGVFGHGLFQSIYPAPQSVVAAYLGSIEWVALTLFVFVVTVAFPNLRIVPLLMFGGTFLVALSYMVSARIEPRFDTVFARLLVAFLAFVQPLGRGWARYFTWLNHKRTPRAVIAAPAPGLQPGAHRGSIARLDFWNEAGAGREELLTQIFGALEKEGWRYSIDTGWESWDAQIYGDFWWNITVGTVTEYHGGGKCLTRVRLGYKLVVTTFLTNFIFLSALLYRQAFTSNNDRWWWALYALFALMLYQRGWRLKRRVADLVIAAADRCGMERIRGAQARPKPATGV
jgi:GT2 family glycosyltransferase